jgi:hypothetical protein
MTSTEQKRRSADNPGGATVHGSNHGSIDEMANGYFQKPDARPRPLFSFRASQALRDKIDALQELWKIRAEVEGAAAVAAATAGKERESAEKDLAHQVDAIDFTYVCARLMSLAADEALSETLKQVGLDAPPANEEELAKVKAAFLKTSKSRSR